MPTRAEWVSPTDHFSSTDIVYEGHFAVSDAELGQLDRHPEDAAGKEATTATGSSVDHPEVEVTAAAPQRA
jgi:hypothetical protein